MGWIRLKQTHRYYCPSIKRKVRENKNNTIWEQILLKNNQSPMRVQETPRIVRSRKQN